MGIIADRRCMQGRRNSIFRLLTAALIMTIALMSGMNKTTVRADTQDGIVREGKHYYCYQGGRKLVKSWKTVGKKTYYFGEDGAAVTGFRTLKKNGKYQLFWFSSKGVLNAKKTKPFNQKEINTIAKKADAMILKAGINGKTDQEEIMKALFDRAVASFGYDRDRTVNKPKRWIYTYASDMFKKKKGSCYHFAAAFGFLVKRATGLPVRICRGTGCVFTQDRWQPHAWTEVKINGQWYVFDTNAARFSTRKDVSFFMVSPANARSTLKKQKAETVEF